MDHRSVLGRRVEPVILGHQIHQTEIKRDTVSITLFYFYETSRRLNGGVLPQRKIIFSPTESQEGMWQLDAKRQIRRSRRTAAKYEGLFSYRRPHTKIFRGTETSHSRPFRGGIPSLCAVSWRYIVS